MSGPATAALAVGCVVASIALPARGKAQQLEPSAGSVSAEASTDALPDDGRAEASARFRRGVTLYSEGDYEAAMIEFRRAYEASPTYAVLYNVGQTQLAMRRYVDALRAFEDYLEQGGDAVDPVRRQEVEQLVTTLRARTGFVLVRTNVDGAEISIDDEVVGVSPLADPIAVDIGRHRISVRAADHQAVSHVLSVAGGDTVEWAATLEPNRVVVVQQAEVVPEESHALFALGITGFVLTGGAAIAAAITGTMAMEHHATFERQLSTAPGDPVAIAAAREQTSTFSLATDVMIGAAILTGALSIAFVVVDPGTSSSEPSDAPEASVSVAPTGISMWGRF